ncbi:TauD/TfdA family dioxygenase [Streptomyces triticagri]|nr:TauD/TfdA family dioxygenase [Streptomyces triticagri]
MGTGVERLLDDLQKHGLSIVQLDAPLQGPVFRHLGSLLGEAIPELDPAVQPYVEDGVVLNLVADAGVTGDIHLQPFGTTPLSLHSEGSGRCIADQPRYIVLMCVEPGDDDSAQTVLIPMVSVAAGLSPDDLRLLGHTRYDSAHNVPTIARASSSRTVFSFRDFQGTPLQWACEAEDAEPEAVNQALRRLLAQMYDRRHAHGVTWTRGLLIVMDNTRFFHGRTAGPVRMVHQPRHLKRLRIR